MIACPKCGNQETRCMETRPTKSGVRRRRVCDCGHRITTLEVVAHGPNRAALDEAVLVRRCDLEALTAVVKALQASQIVADHLAAGAGEG